MNAEKQKINELNVFPVPDGDTGTNMSLTISTAAAELRQKKPTTVEKAASVCASAMLRGARGNSGVILSLIFRGFSRAMKDKTEMNGIDLADALNAGVIAAYKAVMKPAEGTVLTVSRLAGERAGRAAEENSAFEYVLESSIERAREALADTINQNPVLKKAGVVDAGGMGFVVILQGMLDELRGVAAPDEDEADKPAQDKADFGSLADEEITFTYDTVFIVRRTGGKPLDEYRAWLETMGDSLVIGEGDEEFKVHVHTDEPGRRPDQGRQVRHAGAGQDREHAHPAGRAGRRQAGPEHRRPGGRGSRAGGHGAPERCPGEEVRLRRRVPPARAWPRSSMTWAWTASSAGARP